jgi:signal transduction histidine kinase
VKVVSQGHDPLVWGDPELLDTMVGNLVANAREHGGGRIQVSVVVDDGDSGRAPVARVEVRDHGPGLPPGTTEAIFERFNPGANGASRSGLGLGLFLVRELAHLHGGDAGVDSPPDGGATFWFTLPLGVEHIGMEDLSPDLPGG